MSEIRLENLRKVFDGETVAVDDVNITFPSATLTCILGPSGCGKTTLLRMIAGLETPTRGDVYFGDQRVTSLKPSQRRIGMVFQYPVVYPGVSVRRNIELPLLEQEISENERERRIEEVIEIVGLKELLERDVRSLDVGARQKVSVARTVARQPDILLFDEPITNVDVETKVQLKRSLKELARNLEHTILYVTHDQTSAMTLADQIALMSDGNIVQADAPRRLYNNPDDRFGGWFLGNPGMNFFEDEIQRENGTSRLHTPIFPEPLELNGVDGHETVTLGIRPEQISVHGEETPDAVRAEVINKSVYVGGQYLLSLRIGDRLLKAKVDPERGRQLNETVWLRCPDRWISLFAADGSRLEAELSR